MKKFLTTLLKCFIKWDLFLILFLAIGSVFLISKVPQLQIRADNEILLNKTSQAYQDYTSFIKQFSSDRILITLIKGDIFNVDHLNLINDFTLNAQQLDGVSEVISITNAEGFDKSFFTMSTFPVFKKWHDEHKDMAWFKQYIESNHFITQNILAKDQSATLVLLILNDNLDEEKRNNLIVNVQHLLPYVQTDHLQATLAGVPLEEYLFLNNIKSDQKTLVPFIFIFLAVMCFIFMRGWAAIISALGSIVLTILWMQGTIVWFGRYINPITSLLSPVVMVISLAHVIHIFNHLGHHASITRKNVNKIIFDIVAQVGMPSFLAAATTAIGFISLCVSDNPAVKEFGIFASLASCYSFVISFALSIVIIKRISVLNKTNGVYFPVTLLTMLSRWLKKFNIIIFLVGAIISGVLINGIFRLDVDTKVINYIKNKDLIMSSINMIDDQFNGSNSLEVILTLKEGTFFDYSHFMMLHQLTNELATIPRLKRVNSFDDLMINLNEILEKKDDEILPNEKRLAFFHNKIKKRDDKKLYKFISKDFKTVRLNCLLLNSSTSQILNVKQMVEEKLRAIDRNTASFFITGRDFLFADMSHTLVEGQIRSMLWAGIPISLMVFLSLMSFRFGIAGMMAMGLPIAMTYGVMGYLGIALNTATIMISSVAMGLLVDDTIHFLYRFKQELNKEGSTPLTSVDTTLRVTGKAIILTSFILIGGFSVGIIGSVIPTIHFSLLMGLAALLSLLVNIIFLPTLIIGVSALFFSNKTK